MLDDIWENEITPTSISTIPELTNKIRLMDIVSITDSKGIFIFPTKEFFLFVEIILRTTKSFYMTRWKLCKESYIWLDYLYLYVHFTSMIDTIF